MADLQRKTNEEIAVMANEITNIKEAALESKVQNTQVRFDVPGQYLSAVVQGIEVARFKPNGDVDLHGTINNNAF